MKRQDSGLPRMRGYKMSYDLGFKACEQMINGKQCNGKMLCYTEHGRTVHCCPVCGFDEGEEIREAHEKIQRKAKGTE